MIPLTDEENKYYKMQKRDLVLVIIIKSIIKSEIILTTQENIEELLIVFII